LDVHDSVRENIASQIDFRLELRLPTPLHRSYGLPQLQAVSMINQVQTECIEHHWSEALMLDILLNEAGFSCVLLFHHLTQIVRKFLICEMFEFPNLFRNKRSV